MYCLYNIQSVTITAGVIIKIQNIQKDRKYEIKQDKKLLYTHKSVSPAKEEAFKCEFQLFYWLSWSDGCWKEEHFHILGPLTQNNLSPRLTVRDLGTTKVLLHDDSKVALAEKTLNINVMITTFFD